MASDPTRPTLRASGGATPRAIDAFRGTARFELLDVLGQGGMGVVYEAFDRERNSRVALKTIRNLTADSLLRFKNEFRALQDLQHPNLVRLDELFEADGTWFFTMELVAGTDLLRHVRPPTEVEPLAVSSVTGSDATAHTLEVSSVSASSNSAPTAVMPTSGGSRGEVATLPTPRSGRVDQARLRLALPQLVSGLSALHAAGKVHRDVKPANVRVTPDGRVVVLDFGLVTDVVATATERKTVGTPTYMAPEQTSERAVGPAADWYAVGVTLYVALTGRPPFVGQPGEVAALKRLVDPVPPSHITPGVPPDLDDLCVALLARDPAQRADGAAILACLGAAAPAVVTSDRRASPFVGRDRELTVLRDAFTDVGAGRSVTVLVHGESGVGKSALVKRFLDGVGAATVVLAGRCYERESVPYKALDQVIDALSHALAALPADQVRSLLPDRIGLVAQVFPALRKIRSIEACDGDVRIADPFQSRAAVFAAMRELWTRMARRDLLVIAIDDLQWADIDSLRLLAHVFEAPAPPLLLCATVRTTADAHSLASLRQHFGADVRDVRIDALPAADARALASALLGVTETRPGRAPGLPGTVGSRQTRIEAIAAEAGGHPMFIEALVYHRMASRSELGPARLDDVLVARAVGLDPGAAPVLELVCLAGGPISQEVCADAAKLPFDEMARLVSILRGADLVRTRGPRRSDAIEPYHDRVREAMVARLSAEARRERHLRLARALEAADGGDAEMLATHFAGAGDSTRAAAYAARAGDRASDALAFAHAARLYRMALSLEAGDEPERVGRLRLALAGALANAGRGREAGEVYLAVAETAPIAAQNELRRQAAEQFLISGCFDQGAAVLRTVLAEHGLHLASTPRRALVSLLVHRAQVSLRRDLLQPRLRDPATIPAEVLARIDACHTASTGLATYDTLNSTDYQSRYLLLALDAGDPYRLAGALAGEVVVSATQGGRAQARTDRLLATVRTLAEQVNHPKARGFATFAAGSAEYLSGRWRSGLALCDQASTIFRDQCTGAAWWSDTIQYFGLECLAYGGELRELARRVPVLLAEGEARGNLYATCGLRVGVSNLSWLVADDIVGAREQVAEAMARWSHSGFHLQHMAEVFALAQVDLYAGDSMAAYRRITGASGLMRMIVSRLQLTNIISLHLRARAALAAAAGSPPAERRRLIADARRCARRIARERMPWSDPLAALVRAGADALEGDLEAAGRGLVVAIAGFDASDTLACAAAARFRLGAMEGGSAGAARIAEATAALTDQTVRRPERLVAMLAPGF